MFYKLKKKLNGNDIAFQIHKEKVGFGEGERNQVFDELCPGKWMG